VSKLTQPAAQDNSRDQQAAQQRQMEHNKWQATFQ